MDMWYFARICAHARSWREFAKCRFAHFPSFFSVHVDTYACMLSRVCDMQKEIATFLRQKNLPYADQLFDPRWLARLALLSDITTQLNVLNVKLQGKYILVTDKHAHITAFEVK